MRRACEIVLDEQERATLEKWPKGRLTPARLVTRAMIVLAAADGMENKDIASRLNVGRDTVATWRRRFVAQRLAGIVKDAPRGGRKPTVRDDVSARIIEWTTQKKPEDATHWSTRTLAKELSVSRSMIQRVWKAHGLKPRLLKTFKVSNDTQFVEKMQDIVGLYLNPPERALVLCCGEKSQIQALDRTQPGFADQEGTLRHHDARL